MIVDCYYNIRKKCFSIRHKGIVIGHSNQVYLADAKFMVTESRRQKVLETGRKNVHAIVRGELVKIIGDKSLKEAYYNPYRTNTFVDMETREPLDKASLVVLEDRRIYYSNGM